MVRRELNMDINYPRAWTAADAIREIFQNCLDEATKNPDNSWYFNYDSESEILRVGNKNSVLSQETLLLGVSTKADDKDTIGKHGEGYKVGTNVLLREGLGVTVYNYSAKEIWHAKKIKSRKYKRDIAVFDIEKVGFFKSVPEQSLIFEITGVSSELYEEVKQKNLWLQDDLGETIECGDKGRVLLDPKYKGKLFVKGLWVCNKTQMEYGYDLNPSLISLDRDRGLVDSFDLQWSLGKVLVASNNKQLLLDSKNKWDGYYIRYASTGSKEALQALYDTSYNEFVKKYGSASIPVCKTEVFNYYSYRNLNPVMVSENEHYYITHSSKYTSEEKEDMEDSNLADELDSWLEGIKGSISKEQYEKGKLLFSMMKFKID